MNDESDDQPIDLSFKHIKNSHEINYSQKSIHSYTSSSHHSDFVSTATSFQSPVESASNSFEAANVFTNPLLSYLLLSNNSASNMQDLLKLYRSNLSNLQGPEMLSQRQHSLVDESGKLHTQLCRADTTENVDNEDDEEDDNDLSLNKFHRKRNDFNQTLQRRSFITGTIGRPLTGRYVRNGTGASESTLILLRQLIESRVNQRMRQQQQSNKGVTSKQHKSSKGKSARKRYNSSRH